MEITQIGAGVHVVDTGLVTWSLIVDGDAVTLVDAGYPGDLGRVEESLARIGRRVGDLAAVLVTHAHVDHIGTLPAIQRRVDAPVYMTETERRHARREYLQQASEGDIALRAWRPRYLTWSLRILALGARKPVTVLDPAAAVPGEPIDAPGAPVLVPTPGHTSGHGAYHLPREGVVFTGDALVTAHPLSSRSGPQLLPSIFHHDGDETRRTLDAIAELDAHLIVPGHGPVWEGRPSDAVAIARS